MRKKKADEPLEPMGDTVRPNTPKLVKLPKVKQTLHERVQDLLRDLRAAAFNPMPSREKYEAIAACIYSGVQTSQMLQSVAFSECEVERSLFVKLAQQQSYFPFLVDVSKPSSLNPTPRRFEQRGDQLRRKLTDIWKQRSPLNYSGYQEQDYLFQMMTGFWEHLNGYAAHPLFYLQVRDVNITGKRKDALLKGKYKTAHWAANFVDWYKAIKPWPYMDKSGHEVLHRVGARGSLGQDITESDLKDPIHIIAFQRLTVLKKSRNDSPKNSEQSPWVALKAVVRERYQSLFNCPSNRKRKG